MLLFQGRKSGALWSRVDNSNELLLRSTRRRFPNAQINKN